MSATEAKVKLVAALLAALAAACGGATSSPTQPAMPARAAVEQRLEAALAADPHRALCERVTRAFAAGDSDALRPLFDFGSFVERIVARGALPTPLVEQLRAGPSGPKNFARFKYPAGSSFRCLGTRTFLGEPHLAVRQWTPTRYDYVLVRLSGDAERPLDDYHVVSSGYLHSEQQAVGLDQEDGAMQTVGAMFQQSYDNEFSQIISAYRTLPSALQASPIAFFHFINAVFTSEPTDSALYREATGKMEEVLRGRDYALAYWRRLDARRRGDREAEQRAVGQLVELLDDYELLE